MISDLIPRNEPLKRLLCHKDNDLVKIVTGIRRCGKSCLLDLFHAYLASHGIPEANIIHMNLESLKYRDITDCIALYDYVKSKLPPTGRVYLIFDEIQSVVHWERALESFRLDMDCDIYITGSNAYLLSSELSTLLSGRYVEIKLLPLSFAEFIEFHDFSPDENIDRKFQKYLKFGGMPVLRSYGFDERNCSQALEGIYSTVMMKDILLRSGQTDKNMLHRIMLFLCSNIGSIVSPNSIGNVLSCEGALSSGRGRSGLAGKTVARYLDMFRNAFIIYQVERYDVKGKQFLRTLGKNYIVDIGFRNVLLGYRDADRGHILENIVFLELLRRGYRVYIGKVRDLEIDFVAERPDTKMYIQVSESLLSSETRLRELKPLQEIADNYEKIILSMDRDFIQSYDGIKSLNIVDWLLSGDR